MLLSAVNYCLKNKLEFQYNLPEYYPEYPVSRNSYYNPENVKKNEKYVNDYFQLGSGYDTERNVGLLWVSFFFPFCEQIRIENIGRLASVLYCADDNFEYQVGLGGRNVERAKIFIDSICKVIDNVGDIRAISVYELQNWKPMMFALYVIMRQIYLETSGTFWKHFAAAVKVHIISCTKECEIAEGTVFLNESEVLQFRVNNSCGYAWILLIQYAENFELSDEELSDELLQNMVEFAVKSLIMCNDLYSFHTDIRECDGVLENSKNMIAVLMRTQCLTLQHAVNKLHAIITGLDKSYADSKRKLFETSIVSEKVKRFCDRIDYMLGGNWITHLTAKRYAYSENTDGLLRISGIVKYSSDNHTSLITSREIADKFEKYKKFID